MTTIASASRNRPEGDWQNSLPEIAWGTLCLFVGIVVAYAITITAAVTGPMPYAVASLVCGFLAFASFTVVHEAGHGNIFQLGSPLKRLEPVLGWVASVPLLLVPYRMFQRIHDRHHAFTNDPDRDPDYCGGERNWLQLVATAYGIPIKYHLMVFGRLRHIPIFRKTYTSSLVYLTLVPGGLILLGLAGFGVEVIAFAVVPNLIAVVLLVAFFDYIPHFPHKALGRYQNTRIFESRWLNLLLLGQNYHLIHHMYPRVPWYLYQTVYRRIRPDLEANAAPIEQFGSNSGAGFMRSPNAQGLPGTGKTFHRLLTVSAKEQLTPDAVAVSFDTPDSTEPLYQAGQYVMVSKWLNGEQQTRCYSLCRSPRKGELTIGVKRVEGGLMSGFIHRDLKVGDELIVQGPFGDFIYPPAHQQPVEHLVLVAGGSGITPVKAIAEAALEKRGVDQVQLIYACRDARSIMFKEELEQLQAQYTNRFKLAFVLEQAGESAYMVQGRLDAGLLETLLEDLSLGTVSSRVAQADFYICGPAGLKDVVVNGLQAMGAQSDRVHVEQFIAAMTEPEGPQYPVEICLADGQSQTLQVAANQTVLEVARAQGVAIPHACGAGTCGTCKVKVDEGKVGDISGDVPGILASEQAAGYTLACQCRPQGAVRLSVGGA